MPPRLLVANNADPDPAAVVNMLLAMLLGNRLLRRIHCRFKQHVGDCQATPPADDTRIAGSPATGPPLTITPPVPAAAAVDDFVPTWPGLTG
jgi:hypothetical protein